MDKLWYNRRMKYWLLIKNKLLKNTTCMNLKNMLTKEDTFVLLYTIYSIYKRVFFFFYYCIVFHLYEVKNRQSSLLVLEIRTAIASGVGRLLFTRELSGAWKCFCILTVMFFTWVYTCTKMQQLRSVYFTICTSVSF